MIVGLRGVANLKPTTMDLKLDRPSTLRSLSCRNPDVKIKAIFVLNIDDWWRSRRIGEGRSHMPVDWLWANRTKMCIVSWIA
jgi:hypothetical protein